MKKLGEFLLGLLAIIVVLALIGVFIALGMAVFYGMGWSTGWLLHLVVGPDIVFGMQFEQFIGMVYVVVGIFVSGKAAVSANVDKKIEKRIDKVVTDVKKEYRGY